MQTVLVDTDIAIDYLRGIRYANAFMDSLWENNTAYLSVLSVYELHAGMKENEREATEDFINACNIETVTKGIAEKGGELYRQNRTKGVTLTSIDCLVAATAIIYGHKIATRNISHYPDKKLLKVIKSD